MILGFNWYRFRRYGLGLVVTTSAVLQLEGL